MDSDRPFEDVVGVHANVESCHGLKSAVPQVDSQWAHIEKHASEIGLVPQRLANLYALPNQRSEIVNVFAAVIKT